MNDDDAAGACSDLPIDDDSPSSKSGIVRIGVSSATGRKEDKVVRLSINIPNFKRNISVEVPLQKILEDDDDDVDDRDDVIGKRSLPPDESSGRVTCSRCQLAQLEDSSKVIAHEIKISLRQLLLSKLLERLAKKNLFRNYEKLLASESGEKSEANTKLPMMTHPVAELPTDGPPAPRHLDAPESIPTSHRDDNVDVAVDGRNESPTNEMARERENISTDGIPKEAENKCSEKQFLDAATETKSSTMPVKVDKSTTIHKDESTQTGRSSDPSNDSFDFQRHSEISRRPKQPSSVSSSCQTDVDESAFFSRAGSEDLKVERKFSAILGRSSAMESNRSKFERTNGELEESEREGSRPPQLRDSNSFRKSSFHPDDSATETESVSSSHRSSVSSHAFHSRADDYDQKSVMEFGKEVAQACQNKFGNTTEPKAEEKNIPDPTNRPKTVTSSKIENHSNKPKDKRSSVTDNYLKNLINKPTSSEQVPDNESTKGLGLKRISKDRESSISASKTEQPPFNLTETTQQQQQQQQHKEHIKGRSFSIKPSDPDAKRPFSFGIDYTKTKQVGTPAASDSNSSTSSQPQSVQKAQPVFQEQPAGQTSKLQQSKLNADAGKIGPSSPVQSSKAESVKPPDRPGSTSNDPLPPKPVGTESAQRLQNSSKDPQVPEHKGKGRPQSSLKNLVSAFETKGKTPEEQPGKRHPYKVTNPLK